MRRILYLLSGVLSAILLIVQFQNCSPKYSFNESIQSSLAKNGNFVDFFKLEKDTATRPLDIIWIIDNSGSMANEVEQVRRNFQFYMNKMNEYPEFRVALLSADEAYSQTLGITLPPNLDGNRFKHFKYPIGSTDGLNCLLDAIGAVSPTGRCASSGFKNSLSDQNFFRFNSQKVIIVVTDDDSQLMTADFLSSIRNNPNFNGFNDDLTVYGWAGLKQTSGIARVGSVYLDLALKTNGKIFDITNLDWSSSFSELIGKTIILSYKPLIFSRPISRVVSIRIGDRVLQQSEFQIIENRIQLFLDVNDINGDVLEVEYM